MAIVFLGFRVLRGFGVFGNLGNIVGQAIDSIEIERERERFVKSASSTGG